MLGRTHMAIGAVAAVALAPAVFGAHWVTVRDLASSNWDIVPHTVITEGTLVVGALVGSLLPDLEQRNSLMSHEVERIGQLVITATLIALVILLHMQSSIFAWALVVLLALLSGARSNTARRIGLAVLGGGLLLLSYLGNLPFVAGILLACWVVGAMFTPHRTFTHSLLGFILLSCGAMVALSRYHLGDAADGIILGYAFHMIADGVAGGVPLLWPWPHRQGIRLVYTGSVWDHMIGGLATLAFIGLAIW
jgi:membrane-bound metal-dependent hydrolase YbcI (DUF457 family)